LSSLAWAPTRNRPVNDEVAAGARVWKVPTRLRKLRRRETRLVAIVCAPEWAALLTENLFGALYSLR
jgi:hypothetical protein